MSKAAAEAIRKMIRDGNYTGWTGEPDSTTHYYFMCCALSANMPEDYELAKGKIQEKLIEANALISLRSLFKRTRGCVVISPDEKDDYWRAEALEWFENLAVELENLGN